MDEDKICRKKKRVKLTFALQIANEEKLWLRMNET